MQLNTRFTITTPAGTISDTGMREIVRLIGAQNLKTEGWKSINPDATRASLPPLPETWEWVWVVNRGEYAGTMAKRVRNYYRREHGIRCPDGFIEDVGNIARLHSSYNSTYTFEFVDTFNWRSGDFGDQGSCFWGSNSGAREMLKENGALAIRFYEDGKGIARAWVVELQTSLFVVFNGYGFVQPTLTITRVLAQHLSATYKRIPLTNNGYDGGTLWINGGIGYLVGSVEALETIDAYDFEWYDYNTTTCENCGRSITEDAAYYAPDDNPYCEDCYYRRFDDCYHCGYTYDRDYITYVDGDAVCDACLHDLYVVCDNCGEYVHQNHAVRRKKGVYCQNCTP